MPDIFVGRQPIFTEKLDIYAYELLFRGQSDKNDASFIDGDAATSQVILNTFADFGLSNLVDDHPAFINLTRYFLEDPQRVVMPPAQVVLEILEDIEPDPLILSSIETLKSQGHTIALDDFIHNESLQPLVDLADIIKIDITALNMQEIKQYASQFRQQGIRLLAEKVETYEEFNALLEIGFDYYQGYFFSRPTVVKGKGLQGNQVSILRLLAMVNNPEIDVGELSEVISTDVSLSHKILKFINSPISGLRAQVESIQRAVVLLGMKTVKNWVSLVALASSTDKPEALSILALVRARTCEQLAAAAGYSALDSFFTTGLFSTLDAMMDQPIDELLAELPLDENLKLALSQHKGIYGEALRCVIAMETNLLDEMHFHNIEFAELSEIYLKALIWADQQAAEITAK